MILYLDASALVKLYIGEPGTDAVERAVAEAESVATSWLAYPEARSAFARLHREGSLSPEDLFVVASSLDKDLAAYELLPPDEGVWRDAGRLAELRGLRALDAVHLAEASLLAKDREDVRMLTFDGRLLAASRETIGVYET
jgi:predicted nucleic acid-binding protein